MEVFKAKGKEEILGAVGSCWNSCGEAGDPEGTCPVGPKRFPKGPAVQSFPPVPSLRHTKPFPLLLMRIRS